MLSLPERYSGRRVRYLSSLVGAGVLPSVSGGPRYGNGKLIPLRLLVAPEADLGGSLNGTRTWMREMTGAV